MKMMRYRILQTTSQPIFLILSNAKLCSMLIWFHFIETQEEQPQHCCSSVRILINNKTHKDIKQHMIRHETRHDDTTWYMVTRQETIQLYCRFVLKFILLPRAAPLHKAHTQIKRTANTQPPPEDQQQKKKQKKQSNKRLLGYRASPIASVTFRSCSLILVEQRETDE